MHAVATFPSVACLFLKISSASTMIPYRGIVVALGIATHDNVPKVVIISQGGSEPRDIHPWEASNFFSRDVIEKAKLIPFDQSGLRREIKETCAKQGLRAL